MTISSARVGVRARGGRVWEYGFGWWDAVSLGVVVVSEAPVGWLRRVCGVAA